jgi:tRNA(Ile2) C34 agmatinyltransferase TiaS
MMTDHPLLVIFLVLVSIVWIILIFFALRNKRGSGQNAEPFIGHADATKRIAESKRGLQKPDQLSVVEPEKTQKDADIEKMISDHRMKRAERSAGFCPKCGRAVQQSDLYCPNCGENIG